MNKKNTSKVYIISGIIPYSSGNSIISVHLDEKKAIRHYEHLKKYDDYLDLSIDEYDVYD